MRQKGRRGVETDRQRALVWPAVLRRAKYGCEGCGARDRTLQWAHLFGRPGTGAGLGAWANSVELTVALCTVHAGEVGCHERVDRHLDSVLADRLRRAALRQLAASCGQFYEPVGDAIDAARALITSLEHVGWRYDAELCRPVREAA